MKIKLVNQLDSKVLADLASIMHETLPNIQFPTGGTFYWWAAYDDGKMVACACLCGSDRYENAGYFARVGVLPKARGRGLMRRFLRLAESKARKLGWAEIYSDTTAKPYSAANFERAGWTQFTPEKPWGWKQTIYWRKAL